MNHFRVARHTFQIEPIKQFYVEAIGLKVLGEFDHEGYKGIFIGIENHTWHLEFTQSEDAPNHTPDEDDLLVFYQEDDTSYYASITRIEGLGFTPIPSKNPYWDQWGKTYLDPDGYRIVICNRTWSNV